MRYWELKSVQDGDLDVIVLAPVEDPVVIALLDEAEDLPPWAEIHEDDWEPGDE